MRNWTDAQRAAIEADSRDILVSAAAGSGKTTVMIERVMTLLRGGATLDRMLIVTFTRAAAGEMRDRLTAALRAEAKNSPHLMRQLEKIGQAQISTLHTFCSAVLKRHFKEADTDPQSKVKDESVTAALFDEALQEEMEELYHKAGHGEKDLTHWFPAGDIEAAVRGLHRFLMAQADPWGWLESVLTAPESGEQLLSSPGYDLLQDGAMLYLEGAMQCVAAMEEIALRPTGPERYMPTVEMERGVVHALIKELQETRMLKSCKTLIYGKLAGGKTPDDEDPALREAFQNMRKKMKELISAAGSLVPNGMKDADLMAEQLQKTLKARRALADLTKRVDNGYAKRKAERAIWDYNDLEHRTLAALKHREAADEVAGRFDHIFVDEYQDVSRTQEAIIEGIHKNNDLFMVGDVKQSIYRFRLADPTLFMDKYGAFSQQEEASERLILLNQNFRSRKNVLDAVNEVFVGAMRGRVTEITYSDKEKLNAGRESDEDPAVELHLICKEKTQDGEEDGGDADAAVLSTARAEAAVCAEKVLSLMKEDETLHCRDIVILLRSAVSRADMFARELEARGVPVYNEADQQYYDVPEVRDMLNLLQVLQNPRRDVLFLSVLRCPCFRYSPEDLADVRLKAESLRLSVYDCFTALAEHDERAKKVLLTLDKWRFSAYHMDFERFVRMLIRETGLYARAGALAGGETRQANLRLLASKAAGGGTEKWTLESFLRHVKIARKSGGDGAATLGENDDVVRIMTIHKSKGLEFPVVFASGLGKQFRFDTKEGIVSLHQDIGMDIPLVDRQTHTATRTILYRAVREKKQLETRSEEARLLYVAMTRAKDRLILTAAPSSLNTSLSRWQTPRGDLAAGSAKCMLDWVGNALQADIEPGRDAEARGELGANWRIFWHDAASLPSLDMAGTGRGKAPPLALPARDLTEDMRPVPDAGLQLKTGVTRLVLREREKAAEGGDEETPEDKRRRLTEPPLPPVLPEPESLGRMRAKDRGSLVHRALGLIALDELKTAPRGDVPGVVTAELDGLLSRQILTPEERSFLPQGALSRYFLSPLGQRMLSSPEIHREWPFTLLIDGGALVQGVIDLAFMENGGWILVDYKTDRDADALVNTYREQLLWYRRALEKLTALPVREMWLYSLSKDRAFEVKP